MGIRSRRRLKAGGVRMEAKLYWEWFCATGSPLAYVLYCSAARERNP